MGKRINGQTGKRADAKKGRHMGLPLQINDKQITDKQITDKQITDKRIITMNEKYKHQRKSIRLRGYDYSKPGLYFVTICCQNKYHLFGKIKNGIMILNDAGRMIKKWYYKTAEKFPNINCLEMVIMPNHFHCIWQIVNTNVGADPRVCPKNHPKHQKHDNILGEHPKHNEHQKHGGILGEHVGSPLHRVVQWFKTMTTNEYIRGVKKFNWEPFYKKMWQRNYYEHIIRNEKSYQNISNYIINNPINWENDKFF